MNEERMYKVILGAHISEKATVIADESNQVSPSKFSRCNASRDSTERLKRSITCCRSESVTVR